MPSKKTCIKHLSVPLPRRLIQPAEDGAQKRQPRTLKARDDALFYLEKETAK